MHLARGIVVSALLIAAAALLVINAGDHAWIQSTPGYQGLAIMVALNTLGFALIASTKMGYRSGRVALEKRR